MISAFFANVYAKKQGGTWSAADFIPDFRSVDPKKQAQKLKQGILGMVISKGDDKAKKRAKDKLNEQAELIRGTDGKYYKYAIEEFIPKRTKPPKRLRKKDGNR